MKHGVVAGEGCILGASVSDSASEAASTEAYGVFAEEARELDPHYAPETINIDGWLGRHAGSLETLVSEHHRYHHIKTMTT
jgi:hypothetical protein